MMIVPHRFAAPASVFQRGWKSSVFAFTICCFVVLLINAAVLAWAANTRGIVADDGTVTLRQGSNADECVRIARIDRWAHLLINFLSTVLLAGSNYCMQVLAAPTRLEVDAAHGKGRWFDIGVPALRHVHRLPWRRSLIWLVLGVSSLPLHLFYNSALFTSTSSNNYVVLSVSEAFLKSNDPASFAFRDTSNILYPGTIAELQSSVSADSVVALATRLHDEANSGGLVNLTNLECIGAYTRTFQSTYRNLLLVSQPDTNRFGTEGGVAYLNARFFEDSNCGPEQAFAWTCALNGTVKTAWAVTGYSDAGRCDRTCDDATIFAATQRNASNWNPLGPDVLYCLAQPSEGDCQLRFSVGIAVTVVVLNFVKLAMMAAILLVAFPLGAPLLTMGDAVASFLQRPSPQTKSMCLVTRTEIKRELSKLVSGPKFFQQQEKKYTGIRQRWGATISLMRWIVCLLFYLAGLGAIGGYFGYGVSVLRGEKTMSSLWAMGFGSTSGRALVQNPSIPKLGASALVSNAVIANIGQLILSLLYFTYNGLFTCMLLGSEWDSYATTRKGLRVSTSSPVGAQRSRYFLQLPLRYGIPLCACSLIFHWMVSQSIFVVNVTMLDYQGQPVIDGKDTTGHLLTCGYSPIAIFFALILGICMVITLIGFGMKRFKSGMPVASSCSAAIAAACHPELEESEDPNITLLPLQWGEVNSCSERPSTHKTNETFDIHSGKGVQEKSATIATELVAVDDNSVGRNIGHCTFSSRPVMTPVRQRTYS